MTDTISLIRGVWALQLACSRVFFIEVSVHRKKSDVYVLGISILRLFLRFFLQILELFTKCGIFLSFILYLTTKMLQAKNKFKLLKYLISIKIYTHNSKTKFREKKKVWFNKTQWDRRVCHLILFRVSTQYIFGSILPQNETMLTGNVDNDALTSVCFTVAK